MYIVYQCPALSRIFKIMFVAQYNIFPPKMCSLSTCELMALVYIYDSIHKIEHIERTQPFALHLCRSHRGTGGVRIHWFIPKPFYNTLQQTALHASQPNPFCPHLRYVGTYIYIYIYVVSSHNTLSTLIR